MLNKIISVAPMMNCTDRHARYFLRLISPHVLLYTEMITANALLYGNFQKLLYFHPNEHPVALQLGGSDPKDLAHGARLGEDFGYDEINLNVGCPSDRVKAGQFGACLMLQPERVAECIAAMVSAVKIPVTIKCRIGVDHQDSFEELSEFIRLNYAVGCMTFIIHARKAWLKGLSPKENREIPPLQYDVVHQIKKKFPKLTIIINGGIKKLSHLEEQLLHVDGVMIGREAYSNPYFLAEIEREIFHTEPPTREEILAKMIPYIEKEMQNNAKFSSIAKHMLGLYHGQNGGRKFRRYLSEGRTLTHRDLFSFQF